MKRSGIFLVLGLALAAAVLIAVWVGTSAESPRRGRHEFERPAVAPSPEDDAIRLAVYRDEFKGVRRSAGTPTDLYYYFLDESPAVIDALNQLPPEDPRTQAVVIVAKDRSHTVGAMKESRPVHVDSGLRGEEYSTRIVARKATSATVHLFWYAGPLAGRVDEVSLVKKDHRWVVVGRRLLLIS